MARVLAPPGTHIQVHDATNKDYEGTIDPLTDETWLVLKNGNGQIAVRKHYIVSWWKT